MYLRGINFLSNFLTQKFDFEICHCLRGVIFFRIFFYNAKKMNSRRYSLTNKSILAFWGEIPMIAPKKIGPEVSRDQKFRNLIPKFVFTFEESIAFQIFSPEIWFQRLPLPSRSQFFQDPFLQRQKIEFSKVLIDK